MTQDQENVTSMMETTLTFLDENNSVWSGKVAFTAAVNKAKAGVAAIREAAARQESPTGGISEEKAALRIKLEDLVLEIGDSAAAFASESANADLAADVHVSRSSLDQAQDDNLVQIAERVRDAATAHVGQLKDYQVENAEITALSEAITAFAGMKTAPRTAIASKSGATRSIASMVQSTRSVFRNQLDKLMTRFRRTHPEFYAGYFTARVIVNRAATRSAKSEGGEGPASAPSGPGPSPAPSPAPPK
jgi:hypothetical protein